MSLVRWNPSRDLLSFPSDMLAMQKGINRVFDNFFRGGLLDDDSTSTGMWAPSVDIAETETAYTVKVELPGVEKENVKITMQDNILTLRGEKKQEKESNQSNYHRVERSFGSFQRSFSLPSSVLSDKIDAVYNNGVLSITLPKAENARPKEIEVKVK